MRVLVVLTGAALIALSCIFFGLLTLGDLTYGWDRDVAGRLTGTGGLLLGLVGVGLLLRKRSARWVGMVAFVPLLVVLQIGSGAFSYGLHFAHGLLVAQILVAIVLLSSGDHLRAPAGIFEGAAVLAFSGMAVVATVSDPFAPPPDRVLTPDFVGVVQQEHPTTESTCGTVVLRSESGRLFTLAVNDLSHPCASGVPSSTPTPTLTDVSPLGPGGSFILYYGEDDGAEWYALAYRAGYSSVCQWELDVDAYEDGALVHTSSGLLLGKAPDFDWTPYYLEPFPLLSRDRLCVTDEGLVESVHVFEDFP